MKKRIEGILIGVVVIMAMLAINGRAKAVPVMPEIAQPTHSAILDDMVKYGRCLIVQEGRGYEIKLYRPKKFEIPLVWKKFSGVVIQVDANFQVLDKYHSITHRRIK